MSHPHAPRIPTFQRLWHGLTAASLLLHLPSIAQPIPKPVPIPKPGSIRPTLPTLGTPEFLRTRCSMDERNSYIEWRGAVYAFVPGEKQQKLFNIVGMSVARCFQNQQQQNQQPEWVITSRELNFYLDPKTNQVLTRWQNPWTQEELPVMHVANNPVQSVLRSGEYPVSIDHGKVTFTLDIPLTYPNVLASDPKFEDYSRDRFYQAGEFFKFTVPLATIVNPSTVTASDVSGSWHRIGPWLPWMKMKGKPGHLIYSATLQKRLNFDELSPVLQQEINSRLPLYREAPTCFLAVKNETSWTYFQKHFDAYLQGVQFPIAETDSPPPCQAPRSAP
jgi:Protein of unknown function (DUF1838)